VRGKVVWLRVADEKLLVVWHEAQFPGLGIGWSWGAVWQLAQEEDWFA